MGIYNLQKFLEEMALNCFKVIALDELRNYRFGVDANGYFKTNVSVIYRSYVSSMTDPSEPIDREFIVNRLIEQVVNLYRKMCRYGITLVMCWDGIPLQDKQKTNNDRRETERKNQQNYEEALQKYKRIDRLMRSPADVKALKDALYKLSATLKRDERMIIKKAIEDLGMPSIQAEHDGEKLCSILAIEGFVYGVYSRDTDNYAFGSPRTFTEFGKKDNLNRETINYTCLETILSDLNLTHSQFLDLCIIAGCDYNEHINRVTAKKALQQLKQYGNYDNIEKNRALPSMEQLNYKRCREIFAYETSPYFEDASLVSQLNFNPELFNRNLHEVFYRHNLPDTLKNDLIFGVRTLGNPKNYVKEKKTIRKSRFDDAENIRVPGKDLLTIREKLSKLRVSNSEAQKNDTSTDTSTETNAQNNTVIENTEQQVNTLIDETNGGIVNSTVQEKLPIKEKLMRLQISKVA